MKDDIDLMAKHCLKHGDQMIVKPVMPSGLKRRHDGNWQYKSAAATAFLLKTDPKFSAVIAQLTELELRELTDTITEIVRTSYEAERSYVRRKQRKYTPQNQVKKKKPPRSESDV